MRKSPRSTYAQDEEILDPSNVIWTMRCAYRDLDSKLQRVCRGQLQFSSGARAEQFASYMPQIGC